MKVSKSDMLELFGIAERTLSDWKSRGMPAPHGKAGWDLGACIQWRMADMQRTRQTVDDPEDMEARERLTLANAQIAEHKLAKARGEIVETSTLRASHNHLCDTLHRYGEYIQRKYGAEAVAEWNDAISRAFLEADEYMKTLDSGD